MLIPETEPAAHAAHAAQAMASSAAGAADLDVTAAWNRCHPHLVPDAAHAALPLSQVRGCSLCGANRAFEVAARLRFGERDWVGPTRVQYCPGCGRFVLPTALRAALSPVEPGSAPAVVTAVDARLWSSSPTFLNIEPTTRCNFKCWYCVGRHMQQADIEVADFARVLDNFPTVKAIALVGEGEPLLHKGFFEMAHMARGRGVRVLMVSNGSAFSESVVRKLCEAEIAYVSVSVDSVDAATFARSRIGGELGRVWEGIEKLRRYRDANGYRYPRIAIKGTLFSHTEDEMLPIVEEARRRGADLFESFQPLNPMHSYIRIYPKAEAREIAEIEHVGQRIQQRKAAAEALLPSAHAFCAGEGIPVSNAGRPNGMRPGCDEEWLYSLRSGHITPCCQIKEVLDPAWNLFERPLQDILSDPHYERVRFNLWNGLFPDHCRGCWKTQAPR